MKTAVENPKTAAKWKRADTDWFKDSKWGVFTHYLAKAGMTADEWNRQVDGFDVPGLARQIEEVGAGYFFLTIGQNSGHFCSPNTAYDAIVGRQPSRLSRRDLVGDLADALAARGIRMMVYLGGHAPENDPQAVRRLRCTPSWKMRFPFPPESIFPEDAQNTDERLTESQQYWEAVIREWSLRWKRRVHGWWIDGCHDADRMYNHPDAPNFRSFAEAMKAGNPDSIVAFNPGVTLPVISHSEFEDYTAGEIAGDLPVGGFGFGDNPAFCNFGPIKRWVNGAQYHMLNFLGPWWCQSPPRFPTELVAGYTRYVNAHDGVVTWDVPIENDGHIPDEFIQQLHAVGEATGTVKQR